MANTLTSRIIKKIKENPATITILFICAVLGGTASMFSSVETIWKTFNSLLNDDFRPHLVSLQPLLSDKQLQEQHFNLTKESEKKKMYALTILLTVKFSDNQLNLNPYLNSINDLSISSKDKNLIPSKINEIYYEKTLK